MRLLKCVGEHAIFSNPIEHAVCAYNRGILRAGKDEDANQDYETVKNQSGPQWSPKVHRDAADEIPEVLVPNAVGNDHNGEERSQGSKEKRIDSDYHCSLFQISQLGMRDFAVHLSQGFFATHGQHRMAEAHKDDEHCQVAEPACFQRAQPSK